MNRHLRLLPTTMLVAFLLLGLKVGEAMRDGRMLVLSFTEAQAQAESSGGKSEAKPASDAKADDKKDAEKKDGDKKADDKKEGEPKVNPPSTQADEEEPAEPPKHEYTQVEVDLLQSLAKRRMELDEWAKQVQLKENMLVATEQRIDGKIASLLTVKKQVEDLLAQYNEQEDTKIKSLVKIYENMKPKDAARIFEELDMPVLLMVVDRMNERKVSPVLAAMSPSKAKDVTVQLAEQRKLQKVHGGPPALPPAADTSGADTSSGDNPVSSPAADSGASSPPAAAAPAASAPAASSPAPPASAPAAAATPAAPPTPAPAR